jgi:hypothetical protein
MQIIPFPTRERQARPRPRSSRALVLLLRAAALEARRLDRADLVRSVTLLALRNYVPPPRQ